MSGAYGYSAADSVTGAIYTWTLGTIDFSGAGYTGPNSPVNQRLIATSNQGPAGANGSSVAAVDVLLTSNDSLSGTTTRDGVALTAGTSRALAEGQTTTSQNGIWLVQSGAWTRPADFNSDALVAASVGSSVYVKPGGLAGGDSTWYLKTGTTIAGAKTYSKAQTGKIAPVRAVQTQLLTTPYLDPWVYDNTAGTWSEPYVVNVVAGNPWNVFDGITPQLGDRLEVYGTNAPESAAISNGVYVITSLGSASTKMVLTRASDMSTSLAFAAPIAYEVYDGTRFKGARRQLVTQGAITLGTTPLQFGTVTPTDPLHVDLSKAPYFVKDWPNPTVWGGADDYSIGLNQALWDYRNTNAVLRLPSANGGQIYLANPLDHYGSCTLQGAGSKASQLVQYGWCGGHMITAHELHPGGPGFDGFPAIGPTVDTATNATSLSTYTNGNGDTDRWFFYNLTHAGLQINDWTQFEFRTLIRFETLGVNVPRSHIASCRGARTNVDLNDMGIPANGLWSLTVNEGSSPKTITATMRLTDTTAGVYGSAVHVGSGTGTVVGDGTVKPTEDAPNLIFKIATGGSAGGALTVQWAIDGQRYCAPVAVPGGGALVAGFRNEVNEFDQTFTAKFNFSGTFVAGDTYAIACTGVNQLLTLTSAVSLAINTNYDICLQYRSGKMYLYVSVAGGTLDASSTATTGVAGTGVLRQRYSEWTCFGRAANYGAFEAGSDINGFQGWLGSLLFRNSGVTALSATVTTLYDPNSFTFTGQKLSFCPNSVDVRKDPAGIRRRRYGGWLDYAGGSRSRAWIVPRSQHTGGNHAFGGIQGMTLASGPNTNQHDSGLLIQVWTSGVFRDLEFTGGNRGASIVGPFFANTFENCTWNTREGFDIEFHQGALTLSGAQNFSGGSKACMMQLSSCQFQAPGTLFMNTELSGTGSRKIMLLSDLQGGYVANLQCDAENQQQNPTGRELIRATVGTGYTFRLEGNIFLIENYSALTQVTAAGEAGKISIGKLNVTTAGMTLSNVGIGNYPPFSVIGNSAPPIEVGPDYLYLLAATAAGFPVPMIDVPNKWRRDGIAGLAILTDANATVTWAKGIPNKLKGSTLTANRVYTLSNTGMVTGDTVSVLLESQGFTTTIANGGPGGTTAQANVVLPAGFIGSVTYRLDETFNLVLAN